MGDNIGMLMMIMEGRRNGILAVNLRVDQNLQKYIKLITSTRKKGTLNLSDISYRTRSKGRLRIKRENN